MAVNRCRALLNKEEEVARVTQQMFDLKAKKEDLEVRFKELSDDHKEISSQLDRLRSQLEGQTKLTSELKQQLTESRMAQDILKSKADEAQLKTTTENATLRAQRQSDARQHATAVAALELQVDLLSARVRHLSRGLKLVCQFVYCGRPRRSGWPCQSSSGR
jgi:hypothetical protein